MANQYRSVLASGSAGTGGDAVAANVLAGKTFTNDNGFDTGTMVNNGAVSQTINAGQSYTIPEGYHNGSGTVTATGDTYQWYTDARFDTNPQPMSCAVDDIVVIIGVSGAISNVTGGTELCNIRTSGGSQQMILVRATSTSVGYTAAGSSVHGICGKIN
jgi:hypothetical protein